MPKAIDHTRCDEIETALMRARCLSKAINFMVLTDDDGLADRNGSTFRAAIEEVNECAHEAIQTAIDLVDKLSGELGNGATA